MADDKILDNEAFNDDAEYITLQFDDSDDIECEILASSISRKKSISHCSLRTDPTMYISTNTKKSTTKNSISSILKTTRYLKKSQRNSNSYPSKKSKHLSQYRFQSENDNDMIGRNRSRIRIGSASGFCFPLLFRHRNTDWSNIATERKKIISEFFFLSAAFCGRKKDRPLLQLSGSFHQ